MNSNKGPGKPLVSVIMGSDSDYTVMKGAAEVLSQFQVPHEMKVVSAHRTPGEMASFARNAKKRGIRVIIAGAGGAAHLPGMVAALTTLPVIGVPVPLGPLNGMDSLLSIVQMPKGVPVATVAIGNATNAGILALQILSAGSGNGARNLSRKLQEHKNKMVEKVKGMRLPPDGRKPS